MSFHRAPLFQLVFTEGVYVKAQRGAAVGQRLFLGLTLTDHNSLDTQRVSHVPIGVLLYYESDVSSHRHIGSLTEQA